MASAETLRSVIEEELQQPPLPKKTAPKVLALATVVAALIVGAIALVGGQPSDTDQQVSTITPPASGESPSPALDLPQGRSSTRVMTANATHTPGIGHATLQRLQAAGYVGVDFFDAFETSATSSVHFAQGYEAEALDVAQLLGLRQSAIAPTPPPVPRPTGADVVVVVGEDLVGTSAGVAPPASSLADKMGAGALPDRCDIPTGPPADGAEVHPRLPTVPGESFTGCPGARRVLPPGAPTSSSREVVITRGRDGQSWTVPYNTEIQYDQMPDGSIRTQEVIPGDAVAAATERVIPPEDLAEMRQGTRRPPG